MVLKQGLILLIPLLIIIPIFVNFSIVTKDPMLIFSNAAVKTGNLTNYLITADVIMDIGMMDSVMSYYSNTTTAVSNGMTYIKMITREPFTNVDYITEQFIIKEGNFTCTNSYGPYVCFSDDVLTPIFDQAIQPDEYISLNYLGSKKFNNKYCDIVLTTVNTSKIQDLMYGLNTSDFSNVNNLFTYSCIDPETGLTIESVLSVKGESNYMGLLVDVNINITKAITSFNRDVPNSLFTLPYELITSEELEVLMNNSLMNDSLY